jgi:hypothetical protein
MMTNLFRWTFLPFLVVMALVAGGAWYQTISIVPFWEKDISMFKNYGHWGIDYFPILSPLMTVLWLILVITGLKVKLPNKPFLYVGHFFFLLLMVSTFAYFAPFLLTNMGHPQANLSDQQLASKLNTWAKWDVVRQVIGLVTLSIFIYTYSKIGSVTPAKQTVPVRQ